jgi:hypothetical protein
VCACECVSMYVCACCGFNVGYDWYWYGICLYVM